MAKKQFKNRLNDKRGSSFSQLSLQLIESATATAIGCGRLLKADFLSARGKWIQFGKILTLVFIPILGGWVFTLYSLTDNVIQRRDTVEAQQVMLRAINLGRLIQTIQKERDTSILYLSKIGPDTKMYLLRDYANTDQAFADMWNWPEEFSSHPKKYFRSRVQLLSHISIRRAKLDVASSDVYEEIRFYSEIVEFFMEWMIERIRESGFGNTWKSLVVFQKITRCMLDTGIERAYGTMFFARGNFPDPDFYDNFFRRIFRFNYNYRSSTFYSDLVDPMLETRNDQTATTTTIRALRDEIKNSNFSDFYTSTAKAMLYFDNVSDRIDFLSELQANIAGRVIQNINSTVDDYLQKIITFSLVATIVFFICPFITFLTESLTSTMQNYSKVLVKASDELNKERTKTDSLLCRILPKPVAEKLKRKHSVDSEYFKSVTIMFTSIVDFTMLSIEYSAFELVDLLNVLYTCIDDRIEKYDAYKVETINDTYMVASGVPVRNGDRHASEIAYLALDIVSLVKANTFTLVGMRSPVHLLIGINTGPVSAGVVGNVMMRYCLFGDTVNIASRMMSHSQPNRVQISETTFQALKKRDSFVITPRGNILIKGKGEMKTYWLIDSSRMYEKASLSCHDNIPGQTDGDYVVFEHPQAGTSQVEQEKGAGSRDEHIT